MRNYLIATIKSWNIENAQRLKSKYSEHNIHVVTNRDMLTEKNIEIINPQYIFFPHWSWIIPKDIYTKYNCVVFHMTDLPFGRGGSPLQNLLIRGIYQTKISAIKVEEGVDTGPVYMKEPVDISNGNADELYKKISSIVFEKMIPRFFTENLIPIAQEGDPVCFKRRKPEQSEIPDGLSLRQLYDYIRMLDGEGYPKAFRKYGDRKIYFFDASIDGNVIRASASFSEDSIE